MSIYPVDGSKERKIKKTKLHKPPYSTKIMQFFHNPPAKALTLSPGIMPLTETRVGGISFSMGITSEKHQNELPVSQNHPLVKYNKSLIIYNIPCD